MGDRIDAVGDARRDAERWISELVVERPPLGRHRVLRTESTRTMTADVCRGWPGSWVNGLYRLARTD